MNFVSFGFLAFLLIVWLLFLILPDKKRVPWLTLASYIFYATWSIPFIGIIIVTTTVDFWISQWMARHDSVSGRKKYLILGLSINLLVLGFFKYAHFLLSNTYGLASLLGMNLLMPPALEQLLSHVILPLGISFYTFEAISYMVDVYRGKPAATSWWGYNFYIMYFPHLISGPIVRFEQLWEQYKIPLQIPSLARIAAGIELIMLGYLFKIFIANQAALIADPVFNHPANFNHLAIWLGVVGFTTQIYFDFMGYTHIARGVSLLFNIELPLNFNHPYLANTISNFWERWHISLSRWIRDYLYIPLGGSRLPLFHTAGNLMLTMLIAGAWHGAGWTFIAWGGYHGVLLAIYHIYKTIKSRFLASLPLFNTFTSGPFYHVMAVAFTFLLVMGGWILFRANSFEAAATIWQHFVNLPQVLNDLSHASGKELLRTLIPLCLMLLCCVSGPFAIRVVERIYRPLPFVVKVQVACVLLILCILFTAEGSQPFIYFQF
ncbi:MAG: MBOAT family protein [Cyanobacteria bacterium]|nr:MBOAT family protein [Cyanobacteriota bacterium]